MDKSKLPEMTRKSIPFPIPWLGGEKKKPKKTAPGSAGDNVVDRIKTRKEKMDALNKKLTED